MKILIFYILSTLVLVSCIDLTPYENKQEIIENMASTLQLKFPTIKTISAKELFTKIEEKSFDYIIVDIRSEKHLKLSIIPGAISAEQFLAAKSNFKDKLIILYSTIGLGANEQALQLISEGFNCKVLKGGTLAWAQNGFDFLSSSNKTKELYIENEAWNILPEGYKGVLP